MLDGHLQSWTDYGVSQGPLWQPSYKQQAQWARTYARAVAGGLVDSTCCYLVLAAVAVMNMRNVLSMRA